MIQFSIPARCPSIQGHFLERKLNEWRMLICMELHSQGGIEDLKIHPIENIRQFASTHMDGPCSIKAEFHHRATIHYPDIDNQLSFIIACFRTEITPEAEEIEEELGTRPWFYYNALGLPGNLDFVETRATRHAGQTEDSTIVQIQLLTSHPPRSPGSAFCRP